MRKMILASLGFTLFATAPLAHANSVQMNLQCYGEESPQQPCGGKNTKAMKLYFVDETYRVRANYNGCYPVSEDTFGQVSGIVENGDEVTFSFIQEGQFDGGGNKVLEPVPQEVMKGTLNLKTKRLVLDTSKKAWYLQHPSVLKCTEIF